MQDITEFLKERKEQYLRRAEHCEEQIEMFTRAYKLNEKAYGDIAGHPKAVIPAEHSREQLTSVISKKNELLGKVELIEELQEKYGF